MVIRFLTIPLLAFAIGSSVGCSKSFHKVEGKVTLGGAPVEGAMVTFFPNFEGGQVATGMTDSQGKFKIVNPVNDKGITGGEYKVLVSKPGEEERSVTGETDPTKAMEAYWRAHGGTSTKAAPAAMPKTTLNARYAKPESTPFIIKIPAEGAITLQLEN